MDDNDELVGHPGMNQSISASDDLLTAAPSLEAAKKILSPG